MNDIKIFQEEFPSLESYWRSIILFGMNVASYKFALAKSLLEIVPSGKTIITLDELAVPFSKHLCEHIGKSPKQCTSRSSQFLQTCQLFNAGQESFENLIDITVKKGFNNVIDAFHNVNNEIIPKAFYEKDYTPGSKKIILTDEIFKLQETAFFGNFEKETEARWNLVETAWELGISRNLLNVFYEEKDNIFYIEEDKTLKRRTVTSARNALNGYQKGKCFYCFDDISIDSSNEAELCDVDHFFPHVLQPHILQTDLDGVWNLVLSCRNCNRGNAGKFARVPSNKYIERLHKRNEFLISSHHPLRETLMSQTGRSVGERTLFLKSINKIAVNSLLHKWETELKGEAIF